VKDRRLRAPSQRTLQQEVDDWLAGVREGRILNKREQPYKPSVIRNYELALRRRVLPELGQRKLADIDLPDLLELKEQLSGEGHGASTIRNTFVPLQAIYRRARRNGAVAINPTADLPLPTAGSRERAATPQEAAEMLEPLGELERALWATAFYAGLRRGELRALRCRDIDIGAGTIAVERGWDDKEGPIAPKSRAGTRTVFLLDTLRPLLEPLANRPGGPDGLLFGLTFEIPFEPKNIARKAKAAWKAVNTQRARAEIVLLQPITFHEARHSFSTFLDHAGISEARADRYMVTRRDRSPAATATCCPARSPRTGSFSMRIWRERLPASRSARNSSRPFTLSSLTGGRSISKVPCGRVATGVSSAA
jgi:integrase